MVLPLGPKNHLNVGACASEGRRSSEIVAEQVSEKISPALAELELVGDLEMFTVSMLTKESMQTYCHYEFSL